MVQETKAKLVLGPFTEKAGEDGTFTGEVEAHLNISAFLDEQKTVYLQGSFFLCLKISQDEKIFIPFKVEFEMLVSSIPELSLWLENNVSEVIDAAINGVFSEFSTAEIAIRKVHSLLISELVRHNSAIRDMIFFASKTV